MIAFAAPPPGPGGAAGAQSMPLLYNNTGGVTNSEASLTLALVRDWTTDGFAELSLWFHGVPASIGSFVEGPAGTYTMTAGGVDIWDTADEMHYAYKTLSGVGSMSVRIESLQNTHGFAKAGVMIRSSLDADSANVALLLTPDNGEKYIVELSNATLTNIEGFIAEDADLTLTINRADLDLLMMGVKSLEEMINSGIASLEGNGDVLEQMGQALRVFKQEFEILPGTADYGREM